MAWKLIRYVRESKKHGDTTAKAIGEWFFEDSVDNTVSWVTTIGAVWVFGSIYIDRVAAWWDWMSAIPVANSIAFFFGGLMEIVAPVVVKNITKWVLDKLAIFKG